MADNRVHKVTLTSGKVVLIREPKIKHNELAIKSVGNRAGENKFLFGSMMQKELLKILIAGIDGQPVPQAKLEDLDGLFTYREHGELMNVIAQLTGATEDEGKPTVEFGSSELNS